MSHEERIRGALPRKGHLLRSAVAAVPTILIIGIATQADLSRGSDG